MLSLLSLSCGRPVETATSQAEFSADISVIDSPMFFVPVTQYTEIAVAVRNTGTAMWHASQCGAGDGFYLSYLLLGEDGAEIVPEGWRAPLPHDIVPGEEVTLYLPVSFPMEGNYTVELDMLQEGEGWLRDKGSQSVRFEMAVIQ